MEPFGEEADQSKCLSVVMPCFNETSTIEEIVSAVLESPFVGELIIIDDGSTDGTVDFLEGLKDQRIKALFQTENQGKGAAIRKGFAQASMPFVIVQDADLEYDPSEYCLLLEPLLSGHADVVYGSRFISNRPHRVLYYWHSVGNRFLTTISNMFSNLNLSDMETCYKAFRLEVLKSFTLNENRFGIEPELTARVAAGKWRVYEVGISYHGRSYEDGKKIGWKDGVSALRSILKYAFVAKRDLKRVTHDKKL
jgi:glycosyltransferase involved in cell wall biosynthesis